jgi:hypothetical protein
MPTERQEVEVVGGYSYDPETGRSYAFVAPGSLTEALLRLGKAAEKKDSTLAAFADPSADEDGPECEAWLAACNDYTAALAALRTARGGE